MRADSLNQNSASYGRQYKESKVNLLTSATESLTASQSGQTFVFSKADGVVVTLPPCEIGLEYDFIVGTTGSAALQIATSTTTELFAGGAMLVDPATATDMNYFAADQSNDDTIDLGAIEQGWLTGGVIHLKCTTATRWHCEATLIGDATLATPFE